MVSFAIRDGVMHDVLFGPRRHCQLSYKLNEDFQIMRVSYRHMDVPHMANANASFKTGLRNRLICFSFGFYYFVVEYF